jgi:8-oxo-dGTP diphosphatase
MWEDDRIWLPMLLKGEHFRARWIFDEDRMLDYELEQLAPGAIADRVRADQVL